MTAPAWLLPLLLPGETPRLDPFAFNAGRPELKGAWFGDRPADDSGESDGVRYVARIDGWPACPVCEEDELCLSGCLRCGSAATTACREQMDGLLELATLPAPSLPLTGAGR